MSFLKISYGQENLTNILNLPATGAIVQAVGQTKGAIGYIGLAYETGKANSRFMIMENIY
jgi:ABC-type phosphate transport system substrate-binding protein